MLVDEEYLKDVYRLIQAGSCLGIIVFVDHGLCTAGTVRFLCITVHPDSGYGSTWRTYRVIHVEPTLLHGQNKSERCKYILKKLTGSNIYIFIKSFVVNIFVLKFICGHYATLKP